MLKTWARLSFILSASVFANTGDAPKEKPKTGEQNEEVVTTPTVTQVLRDLPKGAGIPTGPSIKPLGGGRYEITSIPENSWAEENYKTGQVLNAEEFKKLNEEIQKHD